MTAQKLLIIFGLVLVVIGILWPLISKLGLGRLPGDIVIERENFRLYVPIMTSLLISAVFTLILWLFNDPLAIQPLGDQDALRVASIPIPLQALPRS
jgi:uncharacterized membrane protein